MGFFSFPSLQFCSLVRNFFQFCGRHWSYAGNRSLVPMTTLRESLCLFAPWRKRNYLFEYLYSSLAISISGTPRCPPARRAGGPQEHAGRLYGGVGRGHLPVPGPRRCTAGRSAPRKPVSLTLRPGPETPLPGPFHPGQEVTFSMGRGLPARGGQSDLVVVGLRLERHSPGPILLLSSVT